MSDGPPPLAPNLLPRLSRSPDELKQVFFTLKTAEDVADLLEIRLAQLTYAIWRSPPHLRYRTWSVRKRRGGSRTIDAPQQTHKILQHKLAYVLGLVARHRGSVHGFVSAKSIVTNARYHCQSRWVLNIDLKEFFPSIHFGRVRGMFVGKPFLIGERAATVMAQICCHNKVLPQGAPTSPVISNMICRRLDGELARLAESHDCRYTRYADDITLSSKKQVFPSELAVAAGSGTRATVGASLKKAIESNGFRVNDDKTRLQGRRTRQEVTGLIVNRRPNVRRVFVSQIRAMLHAWERYGYEAAQREFLEKYDTKHRPNEVSDRVFERVIRGKLAFLKQVRSDQDNNYRMLRERLGRLLREVNASVSEGAAMEYDVFICHASEDKAEVVTPLCRALKEGGVRVWVDSDEILWGDSITEMINRGLSRSQYVVIVLSIASMNKNWPSKEINAIMNIEISSGVKRALPLLVGDDSQRQVVLAQYPLLTDKLYKEWSPSDIGNLVATIKSMVARSTSSSTGQ